MLLTDKTFIRFLIVFAATFLFLYFTAQFLTGLAVPGGMYSSFVQKYFNVAGWLRSSLILTTKWVVALFGLHTFRVDDYVLRIPNANGIRIVYACLGIGVMSFWIAYIVATKAALKNKIKWFFGGLILIWIINVARITMVLISGNKGWKFPFGWDHHTWFNMVAYCAILSMMYFFEMQIKKQNLHGG